MQRNEAYLLDILIAAHKAQVPGGYDLEGV